MSAREPCLFCVELFSCIRKISERLQTSTHDLGLEKLHLPSPRGDGVEIFRQKNVRASRKVIAPLVLEGLR